MTTTVKVHVNGNFRATVRQDDHEPVEIHHGEERSFYLPHPASSIFSITEVPVEPTAAE
ncbi:hypothetical protein [Mesorhizobium sp.]|uniref:hypothetical protein n=1 Tax=Mesorhizobium sp. TaxID=1871066 RepID=UPI00257E516B|nr:hypothetical protein [Mesorhizobium sp.]